MTLELGPGCPWLHTSLSVCRSWSIPRDDSHFKTIAMVEKELQTTVVRSTCVFFPPWMLKGCLPTLKLLLTVYIIQCLTEVKQLPQMATHTIVKVREWQTCTHKGTTSFDGIQSQARSCTALCLAFRIPMWVRGPGRQLLKRSKSIRLSSQLQSVLADTIS